MIDQKQLQILISLESIVAMFADLDFQRRAWVGHEKGTASFYEEVICKLFDDLDVEAFLPDLEKSSGLELPKTREFVRVVSSIDDKQFFNGRDFVDPNLLLESHQWKEVLNHAAQASSELKCFRLHLIQNSSE